MLSYEDLTTAEKRIISLIKGKNRMEIDEILGDMQNETL